MGWDGWHGTDGHAELNWNMMIIRSLFDTKVLFALSLRRKSVVCLFVLPPFYVNFCLMKKDRKCESCHAHVTPSTTSWMSVQRTILEFVVSL